MEVRGADHPRRRHEVTVHVRPIGAPAAAAGATRPSFVFTSRPGVFTYGRMDDGACALIEVAAVRPGDRIVDLGCGTGAVGVLAGVRAGPTGSVTFLDSNVRAVALAEINAKANRLPNVSVFADAELNGPPSNHFDLALANPPYYWRNSGIARLFVQGAHRLLRPGGRLYVVTKQADVVGEMMRDRFGEPLVVTRRAMPYCCPRSNDADQWAAGAAPGLIVRSRNTIGSSISVTRAKRWKMSM